MKQFLTCALTLAVILGSATAVSERARAFLRPGQTPRAGSGDEEFVGPFASWWNVKTDCGAVGDGSLNDTAAIQSCINKLGTSSKYVVWFPAGTYKISDVSTTGTAESGATSINVASAAGITAGMAIYAAGIPVGDTVTAAYVPGSTTVPLRKPTTSTLSATPILFGLDVRSQINIALIGDGPTTTSLVWAGSSGGTMLLLDGVAHSMVDRLTFNGAGTAGVLVDQSNYSQGDLYFDEHNQYADDLFENTLNSPLSYGLRCGYATNGCSETEVMRDTFTNLGNAIGVCNSNALDMWVWYSTFLNNGYGIIDWVPSDHTGCYNGGFHAIGNYFSGSTIADIYPQGQTQYLIYGNYSTGSNQFFYSTAAGGQFIKNTVLNTTQNESIVSTGSTLLVDNAIQTKTGNSAPAVYTPANEPIFSVGNTFTVASAEQGFNPTSTYTLDDTVGSVNPAAPTLPVTPRHVARTVYEASPSGTNNSKCIVALPCTIQAAICVAATGSNRFSSGHCTGTVHANKSVVHLQPGSYSISSTASVPANSNIQIIGDSSASNLVGGTGVSPVLLIKGPSQVVLRSFQVTATNTTDGIKAIGIDQPGAMIYSDDSLIEASSSAFLNSDGLNNALVEADNFSYFYSQIGASSTGIVKTGNNTINVFMAAAAKVFQDASIAGNGAYLQLGVRNDGPTSIPQTLSVGVTGGGSVVEGANQRGLGSNQQSYDISAFTGKLFSFDTWYVVCSAEGGNVDITGSQNGAQELILFNWFSNAGNVSNTASGNQLDFIGNIGYDPSCGVARISDVTSGISGVMDSTFIRSVLAPLRAASPQLPHAHPVGVTNIEMYRLDVITAANNMHLTP